MSKFLEALHSGRVLLMDGAMGTELIRAGLPLGEPCESWNLTHPERVQAVHQAYVDAGAEVLLTNTFQANPGILSRHGLADVMGEMQKTAVSLARAASASQIYLLYDIGPPSQFSPSARFTEFMLLDWLSCLKRVDGFVLETFSDASSPLLEVVNRARQPIRSGGMRDMVPVLLSLAFEQSPQGPCTRDGKSPEDWANLATEISVSALGINCGRDIGMDEVIEIVRRYRQVTDLPLFARPNAGTPKRDGDRWVYPLAPAEMARRLPELLEAGVSMVGGCCGTTPEHIAAMRPVVEEWNARKGGTP